MVLKGVNFDTNQGLNGGCILLSKASLRVTLSLMRNNKALNTGGTIYSSNSNVFIDKSFLDKNSAFKASFLYIVGYNGITSFIGDVYISANEASFNTINIVDSQIEMDNTYFSDNISKGGSNGINAVGSTIKATGIQAI